MSPWVEVDSPAALSSRSASCARANAAALAWELVAGWLRESSRSRQTLIGNKVRCKAMTGSKWASEPYIRNARLLPIAITRSHDASFDSAKEGGRDPAERFARRAAYKVANAGSIGVSCDLSPDRLSPVITKRVTSERRMHKATIASGARRPSSGRRSIAISAILPHAPGGAIDDRCLPPALRGIEGLRVSFLGAWPREGAREAGFLPYARASSTRAYGATARSA